MRNLKLYESLYVGQEHIHLYSLRFHEQYSGESTNTQGTEGEKHIGPTKYTNRNSKTLHTREHNK